MNIVINFNMGECSNEQRKALAELLELAEVTPVVTTKAVKESKKGRKSNDKKIDTSTADTVTTASDAVVTEDNTTPGEPVASATEETIVVEETVVEEEQTDETPSIEAIAAAGAKFITANPSVMPWIRTLFEDTGIQKIPDLKNVPDKIPAFVAALRAKGVEI